MTCPEILHVDEKSDVDSSHLYRYEVCSGPRTLSCCSPVPRHVQSVQHYSRRFCFLYGPKGLRFRFPPMRCGGLHKAIWEPDSQVQALSPRPLNQGACAPTSLAGPRILGDLPKSDMLYMSREHQSDIGSLNAPKERDVRFMSCRTRTRRRASKGRRRLEVGRSPLSHSLHGFIFLSLGLENIYSFTTNEVSR